MKKLLIASMLFFNGCAGVYVITPKDCVKACNDENTDYVAIIYANVGNDQHTPTLEDAQAACLCRLREDK